MDRPSILDTAKSHVTQDRQATHGKPEDSFPLIAAFWTVYLKGRGLLEARRPGEKYKELASHDVAQLMVLLKTARSIANPGNEDNYVDQAGYTACAGELATSQKPTAPLGPDRFISEAQAEKAFKMAMDLRKHESKMLPSERAVLVDALLCPTSLYLAGYNTLVGLTQEYIEQPK